MGGHLDLPFLLCFLSNHGKKKGWLGGGVRNTIKVTGPGTLLPALNNIFVIKYFLKQSDTIETRKMASCAILQINCLVNKCNLSVNIKLLYMANVNVTF